MSFKTNFDGGWMIRNMTKYKFLKDTKGNCDGKYICKEDKQRQSHFRNKNEKEEFGERLTKLRIFSKQGLCFLYKFTIWY